MSIQEFLAECKASKLKEISSQVGVEFYIDARDHGRVSITIYELEVTISAERFDEYIEIYEGSDLSRAASILYGRTGNKNWLRFVS